MSEKMAAKAPKKLQPKHRLLALLIATTGMTVREAAEKVGMSQQWAYITSHSPLFKALVKEYQAKLERDTIKEAQLTLTAEALSSVKTIVDVRDGSRDDTARLRAANSLLDRTPGLEKKSSETREQTITVILERAHVEQMQAALEDASEPVLDAEFQALPEGTRRLEELAEVLETDEAAN